jgi:uncharacterized protein
MARPSAEQVIRMLELSPLPAEGGWYRLTWTSSQKAEGMNGRPCGSAIFYLVAQGPLGFSAFHVLGTDEVYHFYMGDPVELHLLYGDGRYETLTLGSRLDKGEIPQAMAPAGAAQGSRLVRGGEYALLGTTMAPAFAAEDFHLSTRAELLARSPGRAEIIKALTRE